MSKYILVDANSNSTSETFDSLEEAIEHAGDDFDVFDTDGDCAWVNPALQVK